MYLPVNFICVDVLAPFLSLLSFRTCTNIFWFNFTTSFIGGSSSGSAISNAATNPVVVRDSRFFDNAVGGYGGAICSVGDVVVSDSIFSGNSASSDLRRTAFVLSTFITSGFKMGHGGAIFSKSKVSVSNSKFTGNSAVNDGGAIYGQHVYVSNSSFSHNSAQSKGGAIYGDECLFGLNNSFTYNSAQSKGGAVYTDYVRSAIVNVSF